VGRLYHFESTFRFLVINRLNRLVSSSQAPRRDFL
jgi:hypothetical protein